MVNVLLKKQLFEIFRSYFYDAKKNRPRSRASTILFFVLYAVLMIGFVGGMFVLLAWSICQPLVASGMGWLYFTLFAGLAILLGVFGSVFNTFSSLYQAKDNDLLLSMPIPIRAILASRLLGVYLMGLMFSGVVLLPAVIFYWCAVDASLSAIAGGVMLVLAVSLFVLVLSCVLGWVVAKISAKLKRKNFLTVFIALVFFGLYYMVCFRASDLLNELLANLTAVGDAVRGAAYPLYLLGRMGEGDWLAIALVTAVTLALCALTYLVLSRTFIGIATASGATAKAEYREKAVKAAGLSPVSAGTHGRGRLAGHRAGHSRDAGAVRPDLSGAQPHVYRHRHRLRRHRQGGVPGKGGQGRRCVLRPAAEGVRPLHLQPQLYAQLRSGHGDAAHYGRFAAGEGRRASARGA